METDSRFDKPTLANFVDLKELAKRHIELSKEEILEVQTKPFEPSVKANANLEEFRRRYGR